MRVSKLVAGVMVLGLFLTLVTVDFGGSSPALADGGYTRNITASGNTNLTPSSGNTDGLAGREFAPAIGADDQNGGSGSTTVPAKPGKSPVNRSKGNGQKHNMPSVPQVTSSVVATGTPGLVNSTDGLNFYQNRYVADGGNQFSVEPPDQGLCASNSFIIESVNDSLQYYSTSGLPLMATPYSLNQFYNYPSAFKRPAGPFGPELTDPTCIFDSDTGRFFHVVLTLDTDDTDGSILGSNHLDLAVSKTSDPRDGFTIFKIPVQDDGTQGTPDHGCIDDSGSSPVPGPCIGDYPHIGADAYGIYLTTNEYDFFGPSYIGSQLYALSKRQLAAAANSNGTVKVVQFDTSKKGSTLGGNPGFTVWPATAPNGHNLLSNGGTEFFLSSTAADEAGGGFQGTYSSNNIGLWGLTNTSSLDTNSPNLQLTNKVIYSESYGFPPPSNQKAGDYPLGQSLGEVEGPLDSNDTRMQQVTYNNGLVYGALDTIVNVGGQDKAGIAYFIVKPVVIGSGNGSKIGPQSEIVKQGYIGVAGNNVNYPAIGLLNNGKGIIAFSLVGDNFYPSSAYASFDVTGAGPIHVAGAGLGPQDGFSEYKAYANPPGSQPRPRWGDYGATAVAGDTIYFANEYIGQTCDLATYRATKGKCGDTRGVLGNWDTRISSVKP